MLDSAPVATPMTHTSRLSPDQGSPFDVDATSQYRRLLGRLIYLTNTRPNIVSTVHNLSQFISAPTTHHQQFVSRLLRYLKGTPGEWLYFSHNSSLHLCGFSDSDWTKCHNTQICHWIFHLLNQVVFKLWRIQTLWRLLKAWLCLLLLSCLR